MSYHTDTLVNISGVIGGYTSDQTKAVAKFGAKYDIPVISFSATASVLTSSPDYPTFMRTIPPDRHLMGVCCHGNIPTTSVTLKVVIYLNHYSNIS